MTEMNNTTESRSQNTVTGVVTEIYPRMCRVVKEIEENLQYSTETYLCTYRRAQLIARDADSRERSPVAPGDRVQFIQMGSKDGVVEKLLPRRNLLQRKAPGKSSEVLHTIATNIDQLAIVASAMDPDFSPGLVDRFLAAATAEKIKPVIIVTKLDLDPVERPWDFYRSIGIDVIEVSATKPTESLVELWDHLRNKCTVFCGHSGVGKTTLLNRLSGREDRVGTVNAVTKKGKHTTTVSKMIFAKDGARWIDTPGIREFALSFIDAEQLIQCFPELELVDLETRKTMPRYESFVRIKASILEDQQD